MIVKEVENRSRTLRSDFEHHYTILFRSTPPIAEISFYPYQNVTHTIRVRNGRALIRISDLLEDAPLEILRAVVMILVYRLHKRAVPERWRTIYRNYVHQDEFLARLRTIRRKRSRKRMSPPRGKIFDLQELFSRLNALYFDNQIQVSGIGWSPRQSKRVLGHYDSAHETIVINRRLDHPLVPEYVICFVLYHEMLHALMGIDCRNGIRRIHHSEFKKAESRFPDYERAREFIRAHFRG